PHRAIRSAMARWKGRLGKGPRFSQRPERPAICPCACLPSPEGGRFVECRLLVSAGQAPTLQRHLGGSVGRVGENHVILFSVMSSSTSSSNNIRIDGV